MHFDDKELKNTVSIYTNIGFNIIYGAMINMISIALFNITTLELLFYMAAGGGLLLGVFYIFDLWLKSHNQVENDIVSRFKNLLFSSIEDLKQSRFNFIAMTFSFAFCTLFSPLNVFYLMWITFSLCGLHVSAQFKHWSDFHPHFFAMFAVSSVMMFGIIEFPIFVLSMVTSAGLSLWFLTHMYLTANNSLNYEESMSFLLLFVPLACFQLLNQTIVSVLLRQDLKTDDNPLNCWSASQLLFETVPKVIQGENKVIQGENEEEKEPFFGFPGDNK